MFDVSSDVVKCPPLEGDTEEEGVGTLVVSWSNRDALAHESLVNAGVDVW
jgi:hypothetical protein